MINPISVKAGYPFGATPYPLRIKNPDGTVFGYRHGGQDYPAGVGTPLYAPHKGTVTMASLNGTAGNEVRIVDGGFQSRLMHLSRFAVKAGQRVTEGQLVGYSGNTGFTTGPHLHWGLSLNGKYVNPIAYVTPPTPSKPTTVKGTLKPGTWNVRSGAGVNFGVIGVAKGGTTYDTVIQANGWRKITFNGKVGYISPLGWR